MPCGVGCGGRVLGRAGLCVRAGRPRTAPFLHLRMDSERLLPAALGILSPHGCLHFGPIPKPVLLLVSTRAYSELLLGSRFFSPMDPWDSCPQESGHQAQCGTERIESRLCGSRGTSHFLICEFGGFFYICVTSAYSSAQWSGSSCRKILCRLNETVCVKFPSQGECSVR